MAIELRTPQGWREVEAAVVIAEESGLFRIEMPIPRGVRLEDLPEVAFRINGRESYQAVASGARIGAAGGVATYDVLAD